MQDLRRRSDRLRRWWPLLVLGLITIAVSVLATGIFVGRQTAPDARLEKDLPPLSYGSKVFRAERIATTIWGEVCGGDVAVAVADLEGDQAGQASWEINDDGSFSSCSIIIAPRDSRGKPWSREMFCTIAVHEVGHLAGMKHSTNPRSVMFPRCSKKNIPRRCMV